MSRPAPTQVAPGVYPLGDHGLNFYLIEGPDGRILIDAGCPPIWSSCAGCWPASAAPWPTSVPYSWPMATSTTPAWPVREPPPLPPSRMRGSSREPLLHP
jgi:hypothetical protein